MERRVAHLHCGTPCGTPCCSSALWNALRNAVLLINLTKSRVHRSLSSRMAKLVEGEPGLQEMAGHDAVERLEGVKLRSCTVLAFSSPTSLMSVLFL